MITLHVLKLLENEGFGTIALQGNETGDTLLFLEKLPVGKEGIYIMSRGASLDRGQRKSLNFDLFARGANDMEGYQKLEEILHFFSNECYPVCQLPIVEGYSQNQYKNAAIIPIGNIENVGVDETDRVIYTMTAQIIYQKEQQ